MSQSAKSSVVVLIGPPASGKSSVGPALATALGLPFADTDALVSQAAGKPVGDIFIDDGDAVFREHERGAVARGLEGFGAGGGILALGSGAVLDPDVRRMLADRVVVYLEAGFGAVAKRTGFDKPRVVIPGNPRGRLRTMLEERRPVYESLAALTISTDDLAPQEVAAELAKRLQGEGA
ncbi:MAG TPA: shikimate kinase [Trebonia sp.]|nr:shikimate kinase [Trebonia sp.]